MIPIEDGSKSSLAKVESGTIARPQEAAVPLTIGQLELNLLARFPRGDAEEWDRMGILVGDPSEPVSGVAVALDPTSDSIAATSRANANVLLTHHPAFLEPPTVISPSRTIANTAGANVFAAVSNGITLMNFHTALDVSAEATRLLPKLLGFEFRGILVPSGDDRAKGYGQLCDVSHDDAPFKLSQLAARCTARFGRPPRVWGDMNQTLETVVIANGSAGNVVDAAVQAGANCLICGEIRYHAALDASQSGLAIIEIGHDASELPLCAILAQAAIEAGIPSELVTIIDQSENWVIPDSTRL